MRKLNYRKKVAVVLLVLNFYPIIQPTLVYGLTSGPAQPEMSQFTPVGTSDMVDLFTGDFQYNIPLLDVEGYPINISYSANPSMDQEASWVGLGWNINPGLISRDARGIPDDFKGEEIVKEYNTKDNITVGVEIGGSAELFGAEPFSASFGYGIYYNNYNGPGINYGLTLMAGTEGGLTGDLGLNYDSQSGVDIKPGIGFEMNAKKNAKRSINLSAGINSREGMQYFNLGSTVKYGADYNGGLSKNSKKPNYNAGDQEPGNLTGNMSINFNSPAYGPSIPNPSRNYSFAFKVGVGPEGQGVFGNFYASGNFYREFVEDNVVEVPSYGSMFSEIGAKDETAALDFAREKDIAVRKESKSLAIPYATYDIFNIQGHDIAGSYHASRNDIGVFRDAATTNSGFSGSGGLDLGGGAVFKAGGDIEVTTTSSTTSGWISNNEFSSYVPFTQIVSDADADYEPYYFNNAGEVIVKDKTLYNDFGKSKATRVALNKMGAVYVADNKIINQNIDGTGTVVTLNDVLQNNERVKRQQLFSILNAKEAKVQGVSKTIENYAMNGVDCYKTDIDRLTWPAHHISEITVTKGDGMRYIFGIPAYNTTKKEVTFNVETNTVTNGLVAYTSEDASINNDKGKDHYFDAQTTPAYAHSFLLTEVLAPDYVDNTGNGITPDDRGKAYKINYTRIYDKFKWRTPIEQDKATYNEGLRSTDGDNKGSIVYGEKEIWLTHSIESKNMVAFFILSSEGRDDALGVTDFDGGIDVSKKLKKIDRIELYSKSELMESGPDAVPIKTVHFEYNYELCKGVPNQVNTANGKLTLKSIYFTYGKSTKGKLNKYTFDYDAAVAASNPDYNAKNYDRWGSYKNHDDYATYPDIEDFPYTIQDKETADEFSTVWNLRTINLPSGGTINVEYESDDYAYVMDRRATQMFFIKGFGNSTAVSTSNLLYDGGPNNYIHLEVPVAVSTVDEFKELYLEGIDYLYYKCYVDVNDDGDYEYVTGYAEIANSGINLGGGGSTNDVWIEMANPAFLDEDENPIAYSSWQFLRLNLPGKAYPGSEVDEEDPIDYIKAVVGIVPSILDMIVGFNNMAKLNKKGREVVLSKSFIRLNNPSFQKFGGGSRVKTITLVDNWSQMVDSVASAQYGQEYSYTKMENGREISSGVASYEPVVGKDENPFVEPLFYEQKKFLAPDNSYYAELPLGESLYPGATVGYSRVVVRNLQYEDVKRTATGYSVSEFYTAREFPTISYFTALEAAPVKPNPILKILNINVKESLTTSQGFVVEINDMHGKPKLEAVYNEMNALISSKKYDYKVDDPNASVMHLDNACDVVDPDGSVSVQTIGMDYDIWQDMREQQTKVIGGGMHINLDVVFLFIVVPIPGIYPSFRSAETTFRSTATTKLIKRAGIIDKITVNENGSEISTENLLYDAETGQVLLTKVTNEYDDPIYKFTYPAHWIYSGMGPAYQNIGAVLKNCEIDNGSIGEFESPNLYLHAGDELLITGGDGIVDPNKLYVLQEPGNSIHIVDKFGKSYTKYKIGTTEVDTEVTIKITRSGYRNLSTIPVGNITSLNSPVDATGDTINVSQLTDILSADATLYSDNWKVERVQTQDSCTNTSIEDAECIATLLNNLFSASLMESTMNDSLTVNEILGPDSVSCSELSEGWGDELFYVTSDYFAAYNFDPTPYGQVVSVPAFYTLQYAMGDCKITLIVDKSVFSVCRDCPAPLVSDYEFEANPLTGEITFSYEGDPYHGIPTGPIGEVITECIACEPICIELTPGDTINPYNINILGVWRPITTYAYNANRTPEISDTTTVMRTDGAFEEFDAFYKHQVSDWDIDIDDEHWIWVEESKLFDKYGNAIESRNALDIYSTAIYGYNKTVPVAVVANSKLNQAAVDNFEDYDYDIDCRMALSPCQTSHFSFEEVEEIESEVSLSTDEYHTGNKSLKIESGETASVEKPISVPSGDVLNFEAPIYELGGDPFIPEFSPIEGDYIVSGWVKVDTVCNCKTYAEGMATIAFDGSATTYSVDPSGPIIEGWQRFEMKFNVPSDATSIILTLNADELNATYFDDIRFHPYHGNMKSYVYDRITMRLMAQLDENNYATLYEYDEEGNLIRVKRETERGIMTIQEGRSHLKPQN